VKIRDILKLGKPCISFEFFPPKTDDGLATLMNTISTLRAFNPSFVSMTYGAGGSTRAKTVELVSRIKSEIGLEAVAHLTCVGHHRSELEEIVNDLRSAGIENILALRGDPPKGQTRFETAAGGFSNANELVAFIRSKFDFSLGVAGYPEKHPESPSLEEDIDRLVSKVAAGADYVVTQLFFSNEDYFRFVDRVRAKGVTVPIIPGIMPVTDTDQVKRFTSLCGAKLPTALLARLEAAGADKAAVAHIGVEHAAAQCEDLLRHGAPGVHFYTLNRSDATREVFRRLTEKGVVR